MPVDVNTFLPLTIRKPYKTNGLDIVLRPLFNPNMKNEGEVSVFIKQERMEQMEKIAKASGVPVGELIDLAISLYLSKDRSKTGPERPK